MSVLIVKPGILSTVQDLGRVGYRQFGINPGGVMDRTAARAANMLVGNNESDAVLEMHFPAAEILFEKPCDFAISGADLSPELDGEPISNWRTYSADQGSTLRFTGKTMGNRAYLAVCGGLAVESWLGSASTNLSAGVGGQNGRKLEAGDRLSFGAERASGQMFAATISTKLIPHYSVFPTVRISEGAEYDLLGDASRASLEEHNFTISNNSNRMGFRLVGEPLLLKTPIEMLSSAVSFGTIQLLPDGQIIVLMADHQTTGGYPRIAHVIERDLPVLAQLGGGDKVAFHLISNADAEYLKSEFEHDFGFLRAWSRLRA